MIHLIQDEFTGLIFLSLNPEQLPREVWNPIQGHFTYLNTEDLAQEGIVDKKAGWYLEPVTDEAIAEVERHLRVPHHLTLRHLERLGRARQESVLLKPGEQPQMPCETGQQRAISITRFEGFMEDHGAISGWVHCPDLDGWFCLDEGKPVHFRTHPEGEKVPVVTRVALFWTVGQTLEPEELHVLDHMSVKQHSLYGDGRTHHYRVHGFSDGSTLLVKFHWGTEVFEVVDPSLLHLGSLLSTLN